MVDSFIIAVDCFIITVDIVKRFFLMIFFFENFYRSCHYFIYFFL